MVSEPATFLLEVDGDAARLLMDPARSPQLQAVGEWTGVLRGRTRPGGRVPKTARSLLSRLPTKTKTSGKSHGFAFPGQGELIAVAGNSRIDLANPEG